MRYLLQIASISILLAVAGCAPPTIQEWRAYAQCRAVFAQARAQQQQNALSALLNHGDYLAQQSPYPPFAGPAGVQPPYLVNCRATGGLVDCYTQIY